MKKLSYDIARKIRISHKQGITSRQLAKKYGVGRKTIMEVIYNKIYKEAYARIPLGTDANDICTE